MKTTDEGIMKLPDKGNVDFGEMIIKEDLFKKGIDPKTITSESQLDTILNTPHAPTKPKKTGEVIDVDFGKNWPEKKAGGGRTGTGLNYLLGEDDQNARVPYKDGKEAKGRDEEIVYPPYETNDPKEAIKEVIQRLIGTDPAKIPITDKMQIMFDLDRIKAGGSTDLFGGELNFGYNKDLNREGEALVLSGKSNSLTAVLLLCSVNRHTRTVDELDSREKNLILRKELF